MNLEFQSWLRTQKSAVGGLSALIKILCKRDGHSYQRFIYKLMRNCSEIILLRTPAMSTMPHTFDSMETPTHNFFCLSILIFVIRVLMNERELCAIINFPPCTSSTTFFLWIFHSAACSFPFQVVNSNNDGVCVVKELNIKHKFFNSTLHILFCEKKVFNDMKWLARDGSV